MTVFLLRAPPDRAQAEALARVIERRAEFVEEEDGDTHGRPFGSKDSAILFWSANVSQALLREGLEARALEAWAVGRLTILRLDEAALPVGLRDLPYERAEDIDDVEGFLSVAIGTSPLTPRAPAAQRPSAPAIQRAPLPPAALALLAAALAAAGVAVAALLEHLPDAWFAPSFWAALTAASAAFGYGLWRARGPRPARVKRRIEPKPKPAERPPPTEKPILAAFAAEDALVVEPMLAALEVHAGAPVAAPGDEGDGPALLRAVASARALLVACSPAAVAADHVKRLVFLAKRSGVAIVPAYVRPGPAPADFAAFLADARPLELYAHDTQDRARLVAQALSVA